MAVQGKCSAAFRFEMVWIADLNAAVNSPWRTVGQVGFLPWMVPSTETVIKQLGEPAADSLLFGAAHSYCGNWQYSREY